MHRPAAGRPGRDPVRLGPPVTRRVEQLLYTWAPRGLEGSNRFQIAAASPGLSNRHAPLTATALKLCRYDSAGLSASADDSPVSFGWADVGQSRFVFRRVYVGRDAYNRPGNFAAHVLAGPVAALPLVQVLGRFNSPAWWGGLRGEPANPGGLHLELLELPQMPPGDTLPPASEELVQDLTGLLLAPNGRRTRLALAAEPSEVIAALAAVAAVLPELLDGVSASSYERGGGANLFQIYGVGRHGRSPAGAVLLTPLSRKAHPQDVAAAVRLALSDDGGDRRLVDAARQVAKERSASFDAECFVSLVGALESIGASPQAGSFQISTVLQSPEPAELVLSLPAGRRAVADHLLDDDRRVLHALTGVARDIAPSLLVATGHEVGRRLAEQRSLSRLPQVESALGRAGPALLDGAYATVLAAVQQDLSLLEPADEGVLLGMLSYAAAARTEAAQIVDLLAAAVPFYRRLGVSAALPLRWRARICAGALRAVTGAARGVADLVAAEPQLVRAMLPHLTDVDELREVVLLLQLGAALQALEELWPSASRAYWTDLAHERATRLTPTAQTTFLAAIAGRDRRSHVWDDIACSAVRRAVSELLDDETRSPVPDSRVRGVLDLSTAADARQWTKLLRTLEAAEDKQSAKVLQHLRSDTGLFDAPGSAHLAVTLVMAVSAGTALSVTDVAAAVDECKSTCDLSAPDLERLLVVTSCRAAYVYRNPRAAHAVLLYLALDMVGPRLVSLDRRHGLADPRLQHLAAKAAEAVPGSLWEFGGEHVKESGGRSAVAWWQTLTNGHQKRKSERTVPTRRLFR